MLDLDAIAPDWRPVLAPHAEGLARLDAFLDEEAAAGHVIAPARERILRAFATPLAEVRVLLVGQDPYPTPGDAVGLSFAVAAGHRLPPSLRNIARELAEDTGEVLGTGDLTTWQAQGVMLLNRVLTVREGAGNAGSHRRRGWEPITLSVIEALAARGGPLVAVLWGNDARALAPLLGGVARVESVHPSPLSASRGFLGSRPFSQVNRLLEEQGATPIRWATSAPTPLPGQPPAR